MKPFRWGIIGLGRIARKFAEGLQFVPNAQLYAVASRDLTKAQAFAADFQATHALGSYEAITQLGDVDAIYIATPHSEHHANTLMCLKASIPVLCEKAFAFNLAQVQEMVGEAQSRKVFLMEALWTRFLPATIKTLELIEAGEIGEIKHISADFGFLADYNPHGRLFNPALAGGSLLDIGIYPLLISKFLLGNPTQLSAVATLTETGVDMACSMAAQFANGATATLFSTLAARTDTTAVIYGTKGKITLHTRFHEATALSLQITGQEAQLIPCERMGDGYCYEARHVQECLTQGLTESPVVPLQFSVELIAIMDDVRKQVGVVYPADN